MKKQLKAERDKLHNQMREEQNELLVKQHKKGTRKAIIGVVAILVFLFAIAGGVVLWVMSGHWALQRELNDTRWTSQTLGIEFNEDGTGLVRWGQNAPYITMTWRVTSDDRISITDHRHEISIDVIVNENTLFANNRSTHRMRWGAPIHIPGQAGDGPDVATLQRTR
jgi:hypothetical protein